MFGFAPKLPISDEERTWVEGWLKWLREEFGDATLSPDSPVILPTNEFFPDDYDGTPTTLPALFRRVCGYMRIDPTRISLSVYHDGSESINKDAPLLHSVPSAPAGYYRSRPTPVESEEATPERHVVALKISVLPNPVKTIATLSHELGHVLLLGDERITHDTPDHEPLTDLLMVFLGMGIFTANSAMDFRQHSQGWNVQRLGYLPETTLGYALARFAQLRGERNPAWAKHLSTNAGGYFTQSARFLEREAKRER